MDALSNQIIMGNQKNNNLVKKKRRIDFSIIAALQIKIWKYSCHYNSIFFCGGGGGILSNGYDLNQLLTKDILRNTF